MRMTEMGKISKFAFSTVFTVANTIYDLFIFGGTRVCIQPCTC
jgi:hypothetical protein